MNGDNDSRFGLCVSIINRAAQGYFFGKLKDLNIGPGQQAYLLSVFPGEKIAQEELVRRLKVDKANVARAVKGLEKNEYVARNRSETDGRVWEISLTERGEKARAKVESIASDWIDCLKKPLSGDEWNSLEEYMRRIADSLGGGK